MTVPGGPGPGPDHGPGPGPDPDPGRQAEPDGAGPGRRAGIAGTGQRAGIAGTGQRADIASGFGVDLARGWFRQDAQRHREDAPRYCPACAAPLAISDGGHGLATEYWVSTDRVFACFCGACGWSGDIVLAARALGHEAEH